MSVDKLKEWIAVFGLGGIVGTVITLIVKAIIERKSEEFRHHWQEERETKNKRESTDRATYNQRLTILVREHLATFIRSGRWHSDDDDLRQLVMSLGQGSYEHFLDPKVNEAWKTLVSKSVELAARRLTTGIGEAEILEYNRLRQEWEDAAKRSFGPLPESPGVLSPRRMPRIPKPGSKP